MQQLLIEMDDFPHSNFCPHGRPVFAEYKFGDIEKILVELSRSSLKKQAYERLQTNPVIPPLPSYS